MDIRNNDIAMIPRDDLKNSCCAPIFKSFDNNAKLRAEYPSDVVFMTKNTNSDQVGNQSERELCSSSISDKQVNQSGRWASNNLPSIYYSVGYLLPSEKSLPIYTRYHRNIYQRCFTKTALISIALMKKNLLVDVSFDQRLI